MAVALVLALVGLPLLPPSHVHRAGIESRSATVVHSHVIADLAPSGTAPHGASLAPPHGSHRTAVFLTTLYDSVNNSIDPPLDTAAPPWVPPLVLAVHVQAEWSGPTPRGSPVRPDPVRGPPAVHPIV